MTDHYDTLGVPRDADDAAIKKAFRKAAKDAHPDREGGSHERMSAVNQAYATLSDPSKRKRYDDTGKDAGAKSMEQHALDFLSRAFNTALDNLPLGSDLVKHIGDGLRDAISDTQRQVAQAKAQLTKLRKQAKQVKRKLSATRADMFSMIAEQKIRDLEQHIANGEEHTRVLELAVEMANDYEANLPPPPPPAPDQFLEAYEQQWPQGPMFIDLARRGGRRQWP